jgi:phage terminase large subunit-like protein
MMFRKPSLGKVIANDLKQAASRVFYYQTRAVALHPEWKDTVSVNLYKMRFANGSANEAIPIDPAGEAGGNDDIVIYSETWAWKYKKAQQMWTETTLSPLKYGESLRWCETYAGFIGDSPVLEQLYEQGVKQGRVIGDELYANDAARLCVLWRTKPLLPWQTKAYYAQEAATLTESEYQRVHENKWAQSTNAFISIEWWDDCKVDTLPPAGTDWVVGAIDAAVSGDCFGIVVLAQHGNKYVVQYARKWDPQGGTINFAEPEAEIKRLYDLERVDGFVYDPYQLHDMATRLATRHGIPMAAFDQGKQRLIADKRLYDLIRQRRFIQRGSRDLREHLENADAKTDNERLRIVKRADHLKIDLAVCLSMAAHKLLLANGPFDDEDSAGYMNDS